MGFETHKSIIDIENEEAFNVGDIVTIKYHNGGGCGGCLITKITDTGFHFSQGKGRDKSIQYKDIARIY
ncbi:MAG: hypothetical protein QM793_06685 [Muricomes sp.]